MKPIDLKTLPVIATLFATAKHRGFGGNTLRGAIKWALKNKWTSRLRGPGSGLQNIDSTIERKAKLAGIREMRDKAKIMLAGTGSWIDEPRHMPAALMNYLPGHEAAAALAAELKIAVHELDRLPASRSCGMSPHDFRREKEARKSNPEAKRAAKDPKFRRNFLRRLATEQAKVMSPPVATIDQISAANKSKSARQTRLNEIFAQRNIALGKNQQPPQLPRINEGILIHSFSPDFARKFGASINMSGMDARLMASRLTYGVHSDHIPSRKSGSKWVGFKRARHDNYVRSFGLIRDPQTFDYIFHDTRATIVLPAGMGWDVDHNGLRAFSGADDYHPTAADLLAKNAGENIASVLHKNAEIRRIHQAEKLAEAAEMMGVYVCVKDSLRAGNCLAGTQQFAARHGLNPDRHYHAPEILAQGNGDIHRVRLAIRAAMIRTKIENERGYALLEEHQLA